MKEKFNKYFENEEANEFTYKGIERKLLKELFGEEYETKFSYMYTDNIEQFMEDYRLEIEEFSEWDILDKMIIHSEGRI